MYKDSFDSCPRTNSVFEHVPHDVMYCLLGKSSGEKEV